MTANTLPRVLCVDDEPRILESLTLTLRRDYEVHIAHSGEEALALLHTPGNFALICTDMRMPSMDGATLLNRVMRLHPEVTRILLTGDPGRDVAVHAVNEGQIFRFLTKPCPPEQLKSAIEAGVAQHRLLVAERVLLQETLLGCIKALIDILAIANPVAFGRASRIKRHAVELAGDFGLASFWPLEAAAMLSQLGYLSLPLELVEKLYNGGALSIEEKTRANGVPEVANKLLGHIPRLEPVLQILAGVGAPHDPKLGHGAIAQSAQILSLVLDYEAMVSQGNASAAVIEQLRRPNSKHNAETVEKFAAHIGSGAAAAKVRQLPLRMVLPGMIFMDDLRSEFGVLLVPRGYEVSASFVERMQNYSAAMLNENVRITTKTTKAP